MSIVPFSRADHLDTKHRAEESCFAYEALRISSIKSALFQADHIKVFGKKMKIFNLLAVASATELVKNPKDKRPRQDMSGVRTNWRDPKCLIEPESCNTKCMKTFHSSRGKIEVDEEMYKNFQACQWTIKLPIGKEISLKFTKMDLEWHKYCAYDKVSEVTQMIPKVLIRLESEFCNFITFFTCYALKIAFTQLEVQMSCRPL